MEDKLIDTPDVYSKLVEEDHQTSFIPHKKTYFERATFWQHMFFDWVYPTIKNIQTSDDF